MEFLFVTANNSRLLHWGRKTENEKDLDMRTFHKEIKKIIFNMKSGKAKENIEQKTGQSLPKLLQTKKIVSTISIIIRNY